MILAAQSGARIGDRYGAFSFTRSELNAATRATVGDRTRTPDWSDLDRFERRLAKTNDWARRQARGWKVTGPGVVVRDVLEQKVFLTDVAIVEGPGPFFCIDRPCTIGQFVFTGPSRQPRRGLIEHEYIHVLQWEGRAGGFARQYLDDLIANGRSYSPSLPLESVAYLWEYRSLYLGRWEPLPWDVWGTPGW